MKGLSDHRILGGVINESTTPPDPLNEIPGHHPLNQVLERYRASSEELARAWRVEDLVVAAVGNDPRAERGRRVAELNLAYAEFCDAPRRSGDLSAISALAVATRWTVNRLIAGWRWPAAAGVGMG
ncbi:MAG: hypothetical protein LC644_12615 [Pseudonocardia sp.]|nr:hypothetical protein [Pseudonocardia sp.]